MKKTIIACIFSLGLVCVTETYSIAQVFNLGLSFAQAKKEVLLTKANVIQPPHPSYPIGTLCWVDTIYHTEHVLYFNNGRSNKYIFVPDNGIKVAGIATQYSTDYTSDEGYKWHFTQDDITYSIELKFDDFRSKSYFIVTK